MTELPNKIFNLEERTLYFSKRIVNLCKKLSKTIVNIELGKQLVRSGCSIGANYREANESLGKKDFIYRMAVARKETKETSYWLELIQEANSDLIKEVDWFLSESKELRNIFSAIIKKSK